MKRRPPYPSHALTPHSSGLALSRRAALAALAGTSLQAHAQGASTAEPDNWGWIKAQQVLDPRWAYFDTARFAPATRAVMAAEYRAREALNTEPLEFYASRYQLRAVQDLTTRLSNVVGCLPDELGLVRSTSAGLEQFRATLGLSVGDEIILAAQLPATLQRSWSAWARQTGLVIKTVQLPAPLQDPQQVLDSFSAAFGERTRLLLLSHVQHEDGAVLPLSALCQQARERGIVTLVEGTLALGALPFTLQELGCDVYAADLSRWLNGPQDTGVLWVRRELQSSLMQNLSVTPEPEPFGVDSSHWPALLRLCKEDFIQHAAAFQALPAALALRERIGRVRMETRLRDLATYARLRLQTLPDIEMLTPATPGMSAAILAVRTEQHSAQRLATQLQRVDRVNVHVFNQATSPRACVRISLHVFNSYDEIERLGVGLQRALRS